MKRISTILLFLALATLLYVNVGEIARISMGLADAKRVASQNHQATLQLTISSKDIRSGAAYFPEKNELRYHGRLYDISARQQKGDNLYLQVIPDEKEEGLLSELKDQVDQWLNAPQKAADGKTQVKHFDLLKDFVISEKLTVLIMDPSVCLYPATASPLTPPSIPVAKTPPKLG